ncbi:MAG: coenzyme F420-0:L-glutamate ligase [Thermoproteota archaeon]
MGSVRVIGVEGLPIIKEGDDIASLICSYAEKQETPIQNGDVIVITHVVLSRAEGRVVNLSRIVPSEFAKNIARQSGRDPALVEVVLRESRSIVRMEDGKLITETLSGLVCANSGVDRSNVPGKGMVALLPKDADRSAEKIRGEIRELTNCDVAVIISDTQGRPLRRGEINIALGVAGINPMRNRRREEDLFGYVLKVKRTTIVDELASAAELVMGQGSEGVPVAIIRGYNYPEPGKMRASDLIRPRKKDMFV